MSRMANRIVTCFLCHNSTTDRNGYDGFNSIYQSLRWPTLFYHDCCGERFRDDLESILGLEKTTQFSRMFRAGATYESIETTTNGECND